MTSLRRGGTSFLRAQSQVSARLLRASTSRRNTYHEAYDLKRKVTMLNESNAE